METAGNTVNEIVPTAAAADEAHRLSMPGPYGLAVDFDR
jgi:aromatic ring-opening dioxygenase LigB subunit